MITYIRKIRILVFALLSAALPSGLAAQKVSMADSLELLLPQARETDRASILNQLAWEIKYTDPNRARDLSLEALQLARKLFESKEEALALRNIGAICFLQGNYQAALDTLAHSRAILEEENEPWHLAKIINLQAISLRQANRISEALLLQRDALQRFTDLGDSLEMAGNANNLALLYERINASDEALSMYQKVLDYETSVKNPEGISRTANNIGTLYYQTQDYPNARKYFLLSIDNSKRTGNRINEAASYHGLGMICIDEKDYHQAIDWLNKAIRINEETGNIHYLGKNLANISVPLTHTGNTDEALKCLHRTDTIFRKTGDHIARIRARNQIARLDLAQKKSASALAISLKNKSEADSLPNIFVQSDIATTLSEIYHQMGDNSKAYEYLKEASRWKDSIAVSDKSTRLMELQTLYEVLKTHQENQQLKDESQIQKQTIMIQGLITTGSILAVLLLTGFSIQLIISRKRLKKSNATKDKLFSIIAHDLRAPFTGLIGLSEILVEQSADEPDTTRRTIAQNLHAAAEEAYGLLQNLLMWSQSQNKNLAISPEPIELNEIIAEAIRLLQLHASEKEIRFQTEIPDNLMLVSDRNMIQSIIRNLLGNAVKFSHPGGTVDLAIQRGNGGITIQIRDRGIGMTPERVKQIFKAGLTSTRGTRNEGGSGLGLVICRDFIRRLKGTLHVTSAPGEGSVFTIYIPETEATTTES